MDYNSIQEQIENLKNDREKVKQFVYTLINEYNTLNDELNNIEDTIVGSTQEQKKYLYSKQRFIQKKIELILQGISSLVKELTDIPEKIVNINLKLQDYEMENYDNEDIGNLIPKEKLYENNGDNK